METLVNNLPVIIVNGATLLIVVLVLIRVFARVIDRAFGYLASGMTGVKDEIGALRKDVRDVGSQTAVAVNLLTQRVSRIEGKIEGIAGARGVDLSDQDDERTPIGPIPTPEDNVYVDPELYPTPPKGKPRARTGPVVRQSPPGEYRVNKPKGG